MMQEKGYVFSLGKMEVPKDFFSCCTLYKFVSSRVIAIKPNPVIQLFDAAAKTTTQHLDLKRLAGPGRNRS